jgi:hypothetical protein
MRDSSHPTVCAADKRKRRSCRRGVSLTGLIVASAIAFGLTPTTAVSISGDRCYWPPTNGAYPCVWDNLGSGSSGYANWDSVSSTGGSMPTNGNVAKSRRMRIYYATNPPTTQAGWWSTSGATLSIGWARTAWTRFQCNNMEGASISVYCKSFGLLY